MKQADISKLINFLGDDSYSDRQYRHSVHFSTYITPNQLEPLFKLYDMAPVRDLSVDVEQHVWYLDFRKSGRMVSVVGWYKSGDVEMFSYAY